MSVCTPETAAEKGCPIYIKQTKFRLVKRGEIFIVMVENYCDFSHKVP